eukprot:9400335-Pyramimonas_sp.AAC.1
MDPEGSRGTDVDRRWPQISDKMSSREAHEMLLGGVRPSAQRFLRGFCEAQRGRREAPERLVGCV